MYRPIHSLRGLFLLPLLLLGFGCMTYADNVLITSPATGTTVDSPVTASVAASPQQKTLSLSLDGALVLEANNTKTLRIILPVAAGAHTLVAKACRRTCITTTSTFSVPYPVTPYPTLPPPPETEDRGNVGDPYEGGAANPAAVLLTRCQALAANTSYRLAGAITAGPDVVCFTMNGSNTILDLGGFALEGRITAAGYPLIDGLIIFNGQVFCNHPDHEGNAGCVWITSDRTPVAGMRLHHLTVYNANSSGTIGGRAIHIDWSNTQLANAAPAITIDHITSRLADVVGGSRNLNISIISRMNAEIKYNDVTCPAGAAACQGVMCYGITNCKVHDNLIEMSPNYTAETGRGIILDQASSGEVYSNEITANNNRAVRLRGTKLTRVHGNTIKNITAGGNGLVAQLGAVHLADSDPVDGFETGDANEIDTNRFEVAGGTVIFTRGGDATTVFHDNEIVQMTSGGKLASMRVWSAGGGTSSLTIKDNPTATVLPAPQTTVEAGAAVVICTSGTATGAGTITTVCP